MERKNNISKILLTQLNIAHIIMVWHLYATITRKVGLMLLLRKRVAEELNYTPKYIVDNDPSVDALRQTPKRSEYFLPVARERVNGGECNA